MCKWLCVLTLCAPTMIIAAEPSAAVIENQAVRLCVEGPQVTAFYDKARRREYIAPELDTSTGLFHVVLVKDGKPAVELDAAKMAVVSLRHKDRAIDAAFDSTEACVSLSIRLSDTPGEVKWTIDVRQKVAGLALGRVDFPVLQLHNPQDEEPFQFVVPTAEGRIHDSGKRRSWQRTYPAELAAQMIACYKPGGGCLLWTDDDKGNVKSFGYESPNKERLSLYIQHRMPYVPGENWNMGYNVRTAFCDGSWRDAAEIYRTWQSGQFWCKTKLRDRTDIPSLLHHPPLVISSTLTKEDLDTLPARLNTYRKRFGVPLIYRPTGWEKHGTWIGIDYFPPSIGAERFRKLADRLREDEIYLCAFISGYNWTIQSKNLSEEQNGLLKNYFEQHHGPDVCERGRKGNLAGTAGLDITGRKMHHICRGTSFGEKFLQDTAGRLMDLGVVCVHDDQDRGPRPDGRVACHDPSHGHPVPCGPWSTQVMLRAFEEIKADAAKRGMKNFLLTKEFNTELFNMTLHAYQDRTFNDWQNPELVPLVQYLNHEYIPIIYGYVTAGNRDVRSLATMCLYGQVPSIAFWGAAVEPVDSLPQHPTAFLDDYFKAMRTYAKPYLLYGKMLRPVLTEVPTVTIKQKRYMKREFDPPRLLRIPRLVQSAWRNHNGNVGVFAVNLSGEKMAVKCPVPPGGPWQATYYLGGGKVAGPDATPGDDVAWTLTPQRLQAIVFGRKEKPL